MRNFGMFFQFIIIVVAIYVAIREMKNKAEKNTWGREPESIFEIVKTKAKPQHYPQVKIELHAQDHYIYVRNDGDEAAKNVILHSKYIEPMDSGDDENGLYIRPGEEVPFFATSFENKKVTRVTISWRDHMGYHKQSFFVKHKNSFE